MLNLYEIAEKFGINYVIRLKANAILHKSTAELETLLLKKCQNNAVDYQVVYGEFEYQAGCWNKSRRVVIKIVKPSGEITFKHTFIVTNMDLPPKTSSSFMQTGVQWKTLLKKGKMALLLTK